MIFDYNQSAFGGTEYMAKFFHEHVLPYMTNIKKYDCVIIPGIGKQGEDALKSDKEVIVWMHNTVQQFHPIVSNFLNDVIEAGRMKYIICVSNYHKSIVEQELPTLDKNKIVVIENCIEPVTPVHNKFDNIEKIKIVHASSSDRGMVKLLTSLIYCDEDFELSIFNDFYPNQNHLRLHEKLLDDPRVLFYGKTPHNAVIKAMAEAHIHAYPSTYPETSCLVEMETMSAGCYSIHSNLGALPETSMGFGTMVDASIRPSEYGKRLAETVKMIRANGYDFSKQKEAIDLKFSFENAKNNWLNFDKML